MKKNGEYIGVDEKYIPEEEKYVESNNNKKGKKILMGLGIGYLIFVGIIVIMIIVGFVFAFNTFGKVFNATDKIIDTSEEVFDNISDSVNNNKVDVFNNVFSKMEGNISGIMIRNMLDQVVISNNSNSSHIISVSYDGSIVSGNEEITELKESIDSTSNYDISFGYDAEGYINLINIS